MSGIYLNRFPIVTGTPQIGGSGSKKPAVTSQDHELSFQQVLQQRLEAQQELTFSKHAVQRVEQRGMELSEANLARLQEGVRLAGQKGLDDTLILVDQNAFLVSVKNSTVITALNNDDLKGNVFTNIDGTVVI